MSGIEHRGNASTISVKTERDDCLPYGESHPLISIGLPVYNGARYLAEAIDSILSQTFPNLELLICDNASTDGTPEIIARYAAKDPRIRTIRHATNIGGANNENFTVELARGKYFRLAAHDDVLHPALLERCLEVLESDPETVLVYPWTLFIDEEGKVISSSTSFRGTAAGPVGRLWQLCFRNHTCEMAYGLARTKVLKNSSLQQNYTDSDRVWISELALAGPFAVVPEFLFRRRYHEMNKIIDTRARMSWFNPTEIGRIRFPNWLALRGYLELTCLPNLSTLQRVGTVSVVAAWSLRYLTKLIKDVVVAVAWSLGRRPEPGGIAYNWTLRTERATDDRD